MKFIKTGIYIFYIEFDIKNYTFYIISIEKMLMNEKQNVNELKILFEAHFCHSLINLLKIIMKSYICNV